MSLKLGEEAPNFIVESTHGKLDFHEWLGNSWGLLFSHPADFTPVCTTELGELAKLKNEFKKRNTKVIAVSIDTLDTHKKWIEDIEDIANTKLNFPIVADKRRVIAYLYNMIHPITGDTSYVRSVYIISPDKKILVTLNYPQLIGRNFNEIVRVIDAIQLANLHEVGTPANWKQGDDVVVSPEVETKDIEKKFGQKPKILKYYLRYIKQPFF